MADWYVWVAAIVCGLAGAAPQAYLFEKALKGYKNLRVDLGLLSVVVSFVSLTLVLLAVWIVAPDRELVFGTVMVVAYLTLWGVEAIRAWRAANGIKRRGVGNQADRTPGGQPDGRPGSR